MAPPSRGRQVALGVSLGLALLLASGDADARRKAKPSDRFVDAKGRFSLKLPHGWELAPMPGDLHGMMFRRMIGDTPAIFRAHVEKARDADSLFIAADRLTRDFSLEIGYRKLTDLPGKVGRLDALRRTHTAYAAGDRRLVRYAVDTVVLAYGHVHFLHFETTEASFKDFRADLEKILGSYQARAGRKIYRPLIGDWVMVGGDLKLGLAADLDFELGDKRGRYRADGRRLTLITPDGRETFDYDLGENSLVLRSPNLGSPMAYRRAGQAEPALTELPTGKRPKATVVGRWRVLDDDLRMVLSPSGSVQFGPLSGRYKVRAQLLTITSAAGVEVTYHYSLHAGRMTLSGGDLERPLVLERTQ